MASRWDKAPWHEGYKAARRKPKNVEWSLASGYRYSSGKQSKAPVYALIKLYNGKTVKVPYEDYDDYIGFHKATITDPDSDVAAYIEKALYKDEDHVVSVKGVGHIDEIEYNPTYQLMRVFFAAGDEVVYFRVPKELYSQLQHLAETGNTFIDKKGVERHVLGKVFWDYVRIRGQREGGRYRYTYMTTGKRGTNYTEGMTAGEKDSSAKTYDTYARNMLTGAALKDYSSLKTVEDKEQFLKKRGIL